MISKVVDGNVMQFANIGSGGGTPEPVVPVPDGEIVTPINDVETWLKCGGITGTTYITVSEVLEDEDTFVALISDINAVRYMVRSTEFASDICDDSQALTLIGLAPYCAKKLLMDSAWLSAICNSDYCTNILTSLVPTMTTNTTPSGQASASSTYGGGYAAYAVFNNNINDNGLVSQIGETNTWVQYKFDNPAKVYAIQIWYMTRSYYNTLDIIIQGSYYGSSWVTLLNERSEPADSSGNWTEYVSDIIPLNNVDAYVYYRILFPKGLCINDARYTQFREWKLYGYIE